MHTVLQIHQGGRIKASRRVFTSIDPFAVSTILVTAPDGSCTRIEIFHGQYENPLGLETEDGQSDLFKESEL